MMKHSIKLIGVDLGGTKVAAGLVENNTILKQKINLIPNQSADVNEIINRIIETIDAVFVPGVQGIGIGVPSLLDKEKGVVYDVQNIPSWKEVPLKSILEYHYKVPVFLDNDANCFALGEYKYGAGQNNSDFVGLTLGTGMGAGIISNGHLFKDANAGSGEFGSIPYLDSIYEDYCSGKFFKKYYNERGEHLYEKAINGDPKAIEAFRKFGQHLGNAIKMIMFAVDPKKIIIGGSVSRSHKLFKKAVLDTLKTFPYKISSKNIEIIYSNTPNIAILGAASLFFD